VPETGLFGLIYCRLFCQVLWHGIHLLLVMISSVTGIILALPSLSCADTSRPQQPAPQRPPRAIRPEIPRQEEPAAGSTSGAAGAQHEGRHNAEWGGN
jgi:hypothetical protein